MRKLIMDTTNLVQQFQQKQLIVFKFPVTLRGVFVLLIVPVWTRGPVWITSGGREFWERQKNSIIHTYITLSFAHFLQCAGVGQQ